MKKGGKKKESLVQPVGDRHPDLVERLLFGIDPLRCCEANDCDAVERAYTTSNPQLDGGFPSGNHARPLNDKKF